MEEIRLSRVRIPTGPRQYCPFIKAQSYDNNELLSLLSEDDGHEEIVQNNINNSKSDDNGMTLFAYALKSPETKRQYPKRLKMFLGLFESWNR